MIQPQELRIGNWVRYKGERIENTNLQLMHHLLADVLNNWDKWQAEIEAIPLSAEVLHQCHFQKDEIEYIGSLWLLHPVQLLDDLGYWYVNAKLKKLLKVSSLHQL